MSTMYKLGEIPVGGVTYTVGLSEGGLAKLKDSVFEQVKAMLPEGTMDVFVDLGVRMVVVRQVGEPLPTSRFKYNVSVVPDKTDWVNLGKEVSQVSRKTGDKWESVVSGEILGDDVHGSPRTDLSREVRKD